MSVLDAREEKLRKKRINGGFEESEESGIESEDEEGSRLKELLKVTECPKVKPESDPKVSFIIFLVY